MPTEDVSQSVEFYEFPCDIFVVLDQQRSLREINIYFFVLVKVERLPWDNGGNDRLFLHRRVEVFLFTVADC